MKARSTRRMTADDTKDKTVTVGCSKAPSRQHKGKRGVAPVNLSKQIASLRVACRGTPDRECGFFVLHIDWLGVMFPWLRNAYEFLQDSGL
ncbi:hypothetical protein CesoFtcFv8_027390 [Champsocephalus esox]|uniref:Uncharacterized protein n=1 Tax=Champsocephalus esox TaxID=159716 RepID=A0AAN8AYR7_9TELE|nr:hypothetical protein CesoFtcFv8_027390 [Champsocephalus esox]